MSDQSFLKKLVISAFIIANLFTILFVNKPDVLANVTNAALSNSLSPQQFHKFQLGEWYVRRYAHLVGLDNRWQMFGRQSRFNWWYIIKAQYADDQTLQTDVLPLPIQSPRSFWQQHLTDFKEAKFYLNIYPDPVGRESYGSYLCRQYSENDGLPIESIIFELHYRSILEPSEARTQGYHLDPNAYFRILDVFKC